MSCMILSTPLQFRIGCSGVPIKKQIELEIISYIKNYEFIFIDKLVRNMV